MVCIVYLARHACMRRLCLLSKCVHSRLQHHSLEQAAAARFFAEPIDDNSKRVRGRIRIEVRKSINKIAKRYEQVCRVCFV